MKKYIALFASLIVFTVGLSALDPFEGWLETSTEHFTFIYEPRDEAAVRELLTFCEEVYTDVTEFLDAKPAHIKCVVYGRIDTANGAFHPVPPHLKLYVASPTFIDLNQNQDNWLRGLLIHELTHYVHLAYEEGIYAFLSDFLGPGFKGELLRFLGGWVYEGITTNTETIFSKSGRGRNHFFELYYKAPVMEDRLFNHLQAAYESVYSPPGGRKYVAGYIIVNYILETYGIDTFTKIHKEFVKFPFLGIWSAIKKVTGDSINAIFRGMRDSLKTKYADDLLIPDGKKITPDIQGTHHQKGVPTDRGIITYRWTFDTPSGFSLFSPDGTGGFTETNMLNVRLSSEESFTAVKDGSIIYYSGFESYGNHPAGNIITSDIYKYTVDTNKIEKITQGSHIWHPAVSDDGRKLIGLKKYNSYSHLVEINPVTGEERLLLAVPQGTLFNPSLSPRGDKITFALNIRGMQDIYVMDYPRNTLPLDGLDGEMIPESFNEDTISPVSGPDWAGDFFPYFKDKNTIWFTSDRTGDLAVYEYTIDDDILSQICVDPVGAFNAFNFGGTIMYTSYSVNGFCLKSKPYTRHTSPDRLFASQEVPPLNSWVAIENSRPYVDFPEPVMWYPYPYMYFSPSPWILEFYGVGVYAGARSLVSDSSWFISPRFRFDIQQLYGTFGTRIDLGHLSFDYTLFQQFYGNGSMGYRQETYNSLTAQIPIAQLSLPTETLSVNYLINSAYTFALSSNSIFSFAESFSLPGLTFSHSLVAATGISFSTYKPSTRLDYFHPQGISGTIQGSMQIPIETGQTAHYRVSNTISINIPSPVNHHVFQLALDSSYGSQASENLSVGKLNPYTPLVSLPAQKGSMKGGLSYFMSLVHADQPLLFDTFFKGLAGIFSVEGLAHWDIQDSFSFQIDRHLYFTLELLSFFGWHVQNHPFRAGMNIKFNPVYPNTFDPNRDIVYYFGF